MTPLSRKLPAATIRLLLYLQCATTRPDALPMAAASDKLLPALAAALLCCALARVAQCAPQNYTSMFSFGDSLTDTGNFLVSSPLSNHIVGRYPYGITYFHRPTGRCSDGRLVVDFLGACRCPRPAGIVAALFFSPSAAVLLMLFPRDGRPYARSASVRPAAAAAVPAGQGEGSPPGRQLRRRRRHRHGSALLPGDRRV